MLKFIRFLDEARWKSEDNYDIPNYVDKDMPDEQKLLTHFLGMSVMKFFIPSERVFERAGIGGF